MDARPHVLEALVKIQIEYVEMPQLKLTAGQVQRLWSLSTEACDAVLAALLQKGFLVQVSDGAYVRYFARRAGAEQVAELTRAS